MCWGLRGSQRKGHGPPEIACPNQNRAFRGSRSTPSSSLTLSLNTRPCRGHLGSFLSRCLRSKCRLLREAFLTPDQNSGPPSWPPSLEEGLSYHPASSAPGCEGWPRGVQGVPQVSPRIQASRSLPSPPPFPPPIPPLPFPRPPPFPSHFPFPAHLPAWPWSSPFWLSTKERTLHLLRGRPAGRESRVHLL